MGGKGFMKNRQMSVRVLLMFAALLVLTGLVPSLAQEGGAAPAVGAPPTAPMGLLGAYIGAGLGAGLVVVGAALGIGRFASAAADGVARQPQAAAAITGAVNLPLFLLEGVAIIGEVVCLLLALKK